MSGIRCYRVQGNNSVDVKTQLQAGLLSTGPVSRKHASKLVCSPRDSLASDLYSSSIIFMFLFLRYGVRSFANQSYSVTPGIVSHSPAGLAPPKPGASVSHAFSQFLPQEQDPGAGLFRVDTCANLNLPAPKFARGESMSFVATNSCWPPNGGGIRNSEGAGGGGGGPTPSTSGQTPGQTGQFTSMTKNSLLRDDHTTKNSLLRDDHTSTRGGAEQRVGGSSSRGAAGSSPPEQHGAAPYHTSEERRQLVPRASEMRLRGTGLCYALKIAEAKTKRHFEALVCEAEHLEKFRAEKSKRVVKMIDWEPDWRPVESGRVWKESGVGNFSEK